MAVDVLPTTEEVKEETKEIAPAEQILQQIGKGDVAAESKPPPLKNVLGQYPYCSPKKMLHVTCTFHVCLLEH